ncbi:MULTISPECIES: 3-hydroxyacyl-CoA dehydrogenase [Rhodococcus]|uniref:3-hydroxyacyl-CoA dehydrogenase n=1 Tax=Rhodococcus TaxID=1827 RepID=UPI0002A1FB67|nr:MULTISPECIES: 3-hydroxyacyl-CoA dehydrogenase [Rhodococcus]ELB92246.1 3-hydroxyacyl-CoA dehydrogenase [Rhodococcus wratislaviensis IFP 2016]MDI9941038.1 3-hydroxyacyl-CoA dehydrogenase [Rhodococcus sp. IEGM 1351]NKY76306.1 3-hydroxyacyl-CoA dehydrogenase [Rhodococcus opacus]CAG7580057.1 3-hydroxybutyryl-CoA dehydrogenase [Rhodococcus opacus]
MSHVDNVTVLGSGVLGGQIAWQSAFKGKSVTAYDISDDAIERSKAAHERYAAIYLADVGANEEDIAATRDRLTYTTDLAAAVGQADLVIEAVPEIPDVKTKLYKEMAEILPSHTLVVTNSSTFLPRDFAADTGRPEKYCALHFANMIWRMNLGEIMAHAGTARKTVTEVTEFAIEIGMVPIPVRREQNGYLVNTWTVPLLNAAQTLVTNDIGDPEDIDRTFMFLGAAMGPLGMIDIIGMKTTYDVLAHWGKESGDTQMSANADYIKENFLDKNLLGMQTGEGYYQYPNPAYARPDFLNVPDISAVPNLVSAILPE